MNEDSTLLQAAYRHDWSEVDRLRARDGLRDVFEAAVVGDVDAVHGFLSAEPGAVGRITADGFTSLHLAAYFGHDAVATALLAAGADPDAVASNGTGLRPLHAATAARAAIIVRALLNAGATVDAAQEGGFTALMAAAEHGDTTSARMLLAAGADPSRPADDGSTARSLAAPETAELLP